VPPYGARLFSTSTRLSTFGTARIRGSASLFRGCGARALRDAPLQCARAFGREEGRLFFWLPGTYSSSRLRRNSETYRATIRSSLAGLGESRMRGCSVGLLKRQVLARVFVCRMQLVRRRSALLRGLRFAIRAPAGATENSPVRRAPEALKCRVR
jgi:hypothetical protein